MDQIYNHYYSCGNTRYNSIQNCQKCNRKNTCSLCKGGYTFINNIRTSCEKIEDLGDYYLQDESDISMYKKCSYFIPHCNTCSSKDICLSCLNHYGLYYDQSKCVYISDETYFKNPNDDLYYQCSDVINKCQKCSSSTRCNNCISGYIRLNNDKSTCHSINEIYPEEYYTDPNDNNMYLKCSSYIENCAACEYGKGCKYCKYEYTMLNDDHSTCHQKSTISLDTYFTEDGLMYYSCLKEKYKNNIKCFSLVQQQDIILNFLEAQRKNYKLYIYMMTHSPLPKDFSLKTKINVYNSKSLRNLEETQVILTTNDDSDGSTNKIITFISEDLRNELRKIDDNIQVEDIKFNYDNPITKTVTENNFCTLKFDKNSELMDTGKVRSLIQAKKIPDCSKTKQSDIISLIMDEINGCDFDLLSDNDLSFSNDNLDLEFISDDKTNTIKAQCDTTEDGINTIQCKIKDDANSKYSLKNNIVSDSNKYIIISPIDDNDKFTILCENNKNRNLIIIVSVVCSVVVFAVIIIIICCIYKKKKDDKKMKKSEYDITRRTNKRNSTISKKKLNYRPNNERLETHQYLSINTQKRKSKQEDEEFVRNKRKNHTKKTVISN